MQRFLVSAKASSRVLSRGFAQAAEAAPATQLTLNFVTPHTPIYTKKVVSQVIVPGAAGEFGLTAGHSPIISELKPGVVTVIHAGGESEKFFISGGFAINGANSVAEVTTPEAVPIGDLDESAIRAGLEESKRNLASATAGSAAAAISMDTYAAMLLAVGKAL
eukprot:gene16989-12158_t